MRKSKKYTSIKKTIKNKTIKKRSKCVYTDEVKRLKKIIKRLQKNYKNKSKIKYIKPSFTKTMKMKMK